MKSAVVTGATGFLGRWLVRELVDRGVAVCALVRSPTDVFDELFATGRLRLVECDQAHFDQLPLKIEERSFDAFYHLSWEGVSGALRGDYQTQLDNAAGAVKAVKAAVSLGCSRFIGMGTIMEEEAYKATCEDGVQTGRGYFYGTSKLLAHSLTKTIALEEGIDFIWVWLTNAYGEGEDSQRFINTTLRKIIKKKPLEFTEGRQNYDFIHVSDAVHGLFLLGEKGKDKVSYTLGSGKARPLRDYIEAIKALFASNQAFQYGEVPYSGISLPLASFSIEKIVHDTGFKPQVPFREGLRRTMASILDEEGRSGEDLP